MAFFMDPGAMFLGCLGPSEQKFLVTLIETAAKSGYTRFVEPCAGTFGNDIRYCYGCAHGVQYESR